MNWFLGLSTHKKLSLAASFMVTVMAVAFLIGYLSINSLQKTQGILEESDTAALDLLQLKDYLTRQRQLILRMILTSNRSEQRELETRIKKRAGEIDALLDRFIRESGSDPNLKNKLVELKNVRTASQKTRDEQVIPLIHAGKTEQAKSLLLGIQQQRFERVRQLAKEIGEHAQNQSKEAAVRLRRNAERSLTAFTIATVMALGIGIGFVVVFAREPREH